jgi:hypothetical protein
MSDIVVNGNASAPAAGAAVVQSAALQSGRYLVSVSVHLESATATPASADLDNMALYSDTTEVAVIPVPEAKSVLFSTPWLEVGVASGKKLSVQAVGNATSALVYSATMYIRPQALF